MPPLRRLSAYAAVVLAIALVTALAAGRGARPRDSAPAAVASSAPADGAMLARPPTAVDLSFTAELNPELTHVSVLDGSGSSASVGRPSLVTPERVRQRVEIATAGTVTVAYHTTFRDGSELIGTLRFTTGSASAAAGAAEHSRRRRIPRTPRRCPHTSMGWIR
jgi:methionine-rich copper-binding protein CopC